MFSLRISSQGIPRIVLYDYKAGSDGTDGMLPFAAAYAKAHNYQVKIVAQGRNYGNAKINLVDQAVRSKVDMTGARTAAKGYHRALRAMHGKTDGFFGPAGERLLASSFLIAKNTPYPDLATAFAFLTLTNLPQRLEHACKQKNHPVLGTWQQVPLRQLIAVKDAEKTHSGITAQAQDVILDLIQEDLIGCFIGDSNTNLRTDDSFKQLLVFVGDDEREEVIAPYITANLYAWVKMNFSDASESGGVLFLDEVDTLGHFPGLPKQANRYRSKGLSTVIGYQTLSQTNQSYGPEGTKELRTSIGSGIYLNPGDRETAEALSAMLGKKEVVYSTTSKTRNGTKGSSTTAEQIKEIPLKRAEEFTTSGRSVFTFTNPALARGQRAFLPLEIKGFKAKARDIKMQKRYRRIWFDQILPQLKRQNKQQQQKQDLTAELNKRIRYVEELFPMPPKNNTQQHDLRDSNNNSNLDNNSSQNNSNHSNFTEPELDFIP